MAKFRVALIFCSVLFLTVEGSDDVREKALLGRFRSLFENYAFVPSDGSLNGRTVDAHPHLLDLQKDLTGLRGNTVRTFTPMKSNSDESRLLNNVLLRFNVTKIPLKESLQFAELRLYHSVHPSEESVSQNLQLVKAYFKGRMIGSKLIDANINGTVSFDVSRTIRRWLKSPRDVNNISIIVSPMEEKGAETKPVRLRRSTEDPLHPLLVLHSDDESLTPVQHKSRNVSRTPGERRRCKKHSFYVDFKKLGWEKWIIAPKGFDSSYCQGSCLFPLGHPLDSTNHASLQSLLYSRHPSKVPPPCCVPDRLLPLSMVFRDENNEHILKHFNDMIVESCACR